MLMVADKNLRKKPVQLHDYEMIIAQIPLGSTRLDSTRLYAMHFGCVELVEQHSSTRSTGSTRRARQALLAT